MSAPPPGPARDALTGLATRTLFMESARDALERARRNDWATAFFAIDLDGFGRVNDELGHHGGDEVLVAIARRLEAALRPYDAVARLAPNIARFGSDEFLLMCENVRDEQSAGSIAARLLDAVAAPLELAGRPLAVTASAGIAVAFESADAERLTLDAQVALRRAKELGGGRVERFAEHLRTSAAALAGDERALAGAIERGELRLHYQPKVSLSSDRIVGIEALVRWEHPERGMVAPAEFIPLAEATGLIVAVGEWVLVEACRQAALWQRSFARGAPLQVAVNLSLGQFASRLVPAVRAAIEETGIAPAGLCLEVTESMLMDDVQAAVGILGDLKALGISISIDDFGTGYSSLAYLRRLPLDEVKIDRSFVAGLGVDPEDTAIVAAIVSLAHALERDVVAEGVETPDQLERLRALGCEFAQGYLLARPLPAAAVEELLARDALGEPLPALDGSSRAVGSSAAATVLIADDAGDIRQLARMALTAAGFAVEEAANGKDALAVARRVRPACAILDVSMPDLTGVEVCELLRSDPRTSGCTIVMLTARADASDKVEAFSSGADEYIVKPFAPRDLVARVRSALRRRRELEQAQ